MSDEEKNISENIIENEEIKYENDDSFGLEIKTEDIESLTENEATIIASKIEIAIDKYEDILMRAEQEALSEEKVIELGFDEDDYYRLKNLDKLIYAHIKRLRHKTKERGFFANIPVWAFVLFIVCALFTIIPVNPYLPITIYSSFYESFTTEFMRDLGGAYVFYFSYLGLFVITQTVLLFVLLHKGKKSKEEMGAFKSYLVLFIINIIIDIPGLIIFLNSILNM